MPSLKAQKTKSGKGKVRSCGLAAKLSSRKTMAAAKPPAGVRRGAAAASAKPGPELRASQGATRSPKDNVAKADASAGKIVARLARDATRAAGQKTPARKNALRQDSGPAQGRTGKGVPDKKGSAAKRDSEAMDGSKTSGKSGSAAPKGRSPNGAAVPMTNGSRAAKAQVSETGKTKAKAGEAGASGITLPNGYRPSDGEPFMNERQRLYFRNKLISWKEEIVRLNRETLNGLHEDSAQHADVADRATFETDRALELRARDRQRKLISKIDAALARIDEGTYGYCEETGEPIGLKRLDARPIATLSIEAQERHERRERVFREE